jgi:hypothetical protein
MAQVAEQPLCHTGGRRVGFVCRRCRVLRPRHATLLAALLDGGHATPGNHRVRAGPARPAGHERSLSIQRKRRSLEQSRIGRGSGRSAGPARSPAGRVTLDDPPGRVSRLMSPPAIWVPAWVAAPARQRGGRLMTLDPAWSLPVPACAGCAQSTAHYRRRFTAVERSLRWLMGYRRLQVRPQSVGLCPARVMHRMVSDRHFWRPWQDSNLLADPARPRSPIRPVDGEGAL